MDGNLTTCLETSALNPKWKNMMLGEMTLVKDVNDTRSNVNITYGTNVNCNDINMVHYRKTVPECSYLKAAALQTGSHQSGTTCHYVVPCNPGNVTCNVEFAINDGNADFSFCEIEL